MIPSGEVATNARMILLQANLGERKRTERIIKVFYDNCNRFE